MKEDSFRDFVLDQLSFLENLECRSMFGGCGLYQKERFFGILFKGKLYFKTTLESREVYLKFNSRPFRPSSKQTLKNYYEVPVEILEDRKVLTDWAQTSAGLIGS